MVSNEFKNMVRLAGSGRDEDMLFNLLVGKVLDYNVGKGPDYPAVVGAALSVVAIRRLVSRIDFNVEVRFDNPGEIVYRVLWPRVDPFGVRWSVATVTRDYDLMNRLSRINGRYPGDHVAQMRHAADYMEDAWLRRLLSSYPAGDTGALTLVFAPT